MNEQADGKWFFNAILHRSNDADIPVPVDNQTNPEFLDLRMRVSMMNDHTFRYRLNPVTNMTSNDGNWTDIKRWEVPDSLMGNTKDDYGMRLTWANFNPSSSPAGFELSNPMNSNVKYVSTKNRNLVFTDKYLEQGFLLDSRNIFGFGERQRTLELTEGQYSSWASGRDNHYDPGKLGGHSYGDHPFVLARLKDNTFVGIFFKNSNAKELEYKHVGNNQSILNFKAIGGILDFFVFFSETAEGVIKSYHEVVGKPYFPPFWALGFHQSSWQYNTTERVTDVLQNYDRAGMPLEGMWLDIEYMESYRNFLVNTTRFSNLPSLAKAIHQKNQKLITIVDAGFAADDDYTYYKQADQQGLFIKSNQNNSTFNGNLIGDVWPGKSAFVDFYNPKSTEFWVNGLKGLHTLTTTDGIWIDMNEVTSFCNGECPDSNKTCPTKGSYSIPYNPLGDVSLEEMAISVDGQHYFIDENDTNKPLNTEYNMHSLYGIMQAKATQQFWNAATSLQGKRSFVLSRSSFAGAGKYTSHWLGDNWSSWEFMQFSISGIMEFNMYGMPLVGADVCGFHDPYEDEMCGRWMQLSTFYPFARNHYNLTSYGKEYLPEQEPYNLKAPWNETAKAAIRQRYVYLRYFYTLLFEATKNGGTMIRPLFFEFPEDQGAYQGYEHSFMVGKALKVTPVLRPEKQHNGKINSYFPANSRFISLNDYISVVEQGDSGQNVTMTPSLNYTIVHQNQGTIIPIQTSPMTDSYPMRTAELLQQSVSLSIFANSRGHAEGTLYIDENGDDQIDIELGNYQYYGMRFNNNTLTFNLLDGRGAGGDQTKGNQILESVYILNMEKYTNTNLTACAFNTNLTPRPMNATYVPEIKGVQIKPVDGDTTLFKDIFSIQISDQENDSSFCSPHYQVKSLTKVYASEDADITTQVILGITAGNSSALPDLEAKFTLIDDEILRIEISNPAEKEFSAPDETFDPNFFNSSEATLDISSVLTLPAEGEDFYYEVHQFEDASKVYYSTKNMGFVYSTYYKEHSAMIDSTGRIFGLGERVGDFFLSEGVYTIWNRDEPSPVENGKRPGNNIYGSHPIYFTQTNDLTEFFAVFDHNAGAQDYIIKKADKQYQITQVKTSGKTDQFIILRTSIQRAVANFHRMVGMPVMVPEWSLGWHQCRYGYNDTAQVTEVVNNYISHALPLDVMWTDIDYMEMYRDFTLSTTDFKDLPEAIKKWREDNNIRYVPILDAAVAYEPGSSNTAYQRGQKKNIFIKDPNNNSKPFIGKVWPGPAVYIDWLKDGAEEYWVDEMKRLHDILPYDGMWIDMNEASNFCDGFCYKDQEVKDTIQDRLFYTPGARDLNVKSISIDALHSDGSTEFEAHSLYGFYMSKATSNYFSGNNLRPFVITRSTYSGVGKYVSHWLGDNFSQWDMLKYSVGGIMLFNMYGVPLAGADICGFISDTWPDLCARWYALGAFYPFSRNHNDKNAIPQEPFVEMFLNRTISGSKDVTYTDFIRETALKRYALHRYHYSYTHKSSVDGTPYFTPLFFLYPGDSQAYKRIEHNVMLGDSVKISPMVDEGTTVTFYFPEKDATWCPIWPKYQTKCFKGQSDQQVQLPYDEVFAHIKSGSIIPLQLGDLKGVSTFMNLKTLTDTPTDIGILADSKYHASGWMRFDDGETMNLNEYNQIEIEAKGANPYLYSAYLDIYFNVTVSQSSAQSTNQNLGSIIIYNASQFSLGNNFKAVATLVSGDKIQFDTDYNKDQNICRFRIQQENGVSFAQIQSVHIGK